MQTVVRNNFFVVVEKKKRGGKGFSQRVGECVCEKEDRLWVCPSLLLSVLLVSLRGIFVHATGPCSQHTHVKQIKPK